MFADCGFVGIPHLTAKQKCSPANVCQETAAEYLPLREAQRQMALNENSYASSCDSVVDISSPFLIASSGGNANCTWQKQI